MALMTSPCCSCEPAKATLLCTTSCKTFGTPDSVRLRGGPMKPFNGYSGFVDGLSVLRGPWLRPLRAAAMTILLLVVPVGAGTANATATAAPATGAHVYLLRGVLNIFSLGLDDIAAKLERQGIPVTIANFVSWSSVSVEAAAEYRSGKVRTIILVGHSSGATALPDMVAKLGQLGVPVKLVIGLDSVFRTRLAGNAERYINFYVASGPGEPVTRTGDFRGALENVDVQAVPGVGHLSIDKNQIMQQKVISEIDAAVFNRPAMASVARNPQQPGMVGAAATRN